MAKLWIPCYTFVEVPPFACIKPRAVLNPSALAAPTLVFGMRPTNITIPDASKDLAGYDPETAQTFLFNRIYGGASPSAAVWNANNLHPGFFTNGPTTVPAKSMFSLTPLFGGVHWLAYNEESDPDHLWFCSDGLRLKSSVSPSRTTAFRRFGAADTIHRCVPVVMEAVNWVYTYSV